VGKWNVLFPGMQGEVRVHVGDSGRFGLVFAESVPGLVLLCVRIVAVCSKYTIESSLREA
jgi:hypothetical protein